MGALPTPGTRVSPPRLNGLGDEPDTTGMPLILIRPRQVGLLCLLVTIVGWGLNWPVMKFLLREWPPLSARGTAGVTAALALALLAALRGERLAVPVRSTGRLLAAAGLNVTAWMGLSTLSLLWLDAGQGALLVYTMPIWATILAWPVLGERPTVGRILALVLGVVGVTMLLGGVHCARPEMLPGVACALGGRAVRPRDGRAALTAWDATAYRDGVAGRARLPSHDRGRHAARGTRSRRSEPGGLGSDGLHDRRPDGRLLPVLVRRTAAAAAGHGVDGHPAHALGRGRRGGGRPG